MSSDLKGKDTVGELYKKYSLQKGSDIYVSEKQKYVIVTRQGIEKIQSIEDICVDYSIVQCSETFSAVKAVAYKRSDPNRKIETFGSALYGDYIDVEKKKSGGGTYMSKELKGSTNSYYVLEIAEKRALSRAVLKLTDLYKFGMFGEDESEEFRDKDKDKTADEKVDTAMAQIKNALPNAFAK